MFVALNGAYQTSVSFGLTPKSTLPLHDGNPHTTLLEPPSGKSFLPSRKRELKQIRGYDLHTGSNMRILLQLCFEQPVQAVCRERVRS